MDIVFATGNAHKLHEAERILGPSFRLLTPRQVGVEDDIPEWEATLIGNAQAKARYIYERTRLDCFADDTGLEVDALGGAPGVLSARYAGPAHDSAANMALLLRNMEGKTDRRACFRTVVALILGGGEHLFEGEVRGRLATSPSGEVGFGYDPIFIPEGYQITFAQMSLEEKNTISHRARALQKLARFLQPANLFEAEKGRGELF
ncbi:non-canonical purine NTP pyrophosphatase [Bacteroidia bacterium]|nr:non-canonical purine NTP pyrophosphatase [Bacteroidia bacterium]